MKSFANLPMPVLRVSLGASADMRPFASPLENLAPSLHSTNLACDFLSWKHTWRNMPAAREFPGKKRSGSFIKSTLA